MWKSGRQSCSITIQYSGLSRFNHHDLHGTHTIHLFHVSLAVVTCSACWQLWPAGSWLLSTGLIIPTLLPCTDALSALKRLHSNDDVDSGPDCDSPVLFTLRYFTSALVWPESDEEKACESVTHGCTHDRRAKHGVLKRNKKDESQRELQQKVMEVTVNFFEEMEYISLKCNEKLLELLLGICLQWVSGKETRHTFKTYIFNCHLVSKGHPFILKSSRETGWLGGLLCLCAIPVEVEELNTLQKVNNHLQPGKTQHC